MLFNLNKVRINQHFLLIEKCFLFQENEIKEAKKLKQLSQKEDSIFAKSKPFTDVSNRRPLLNRNKQPLSSMQRLAETARVKRNLEDSLNYENLQYRKIETDGNTTKCSIIRQPLSSNPVNVKNNSPQKKITEDNTKKQTFQCLLPQNSQATNTGGSSYIRVQNSQVIYIKFLFYFYKFLRCGVYKFIYISLV